MDENNRDIYLKLLTDLKDKCDQTHSCLTQLDKKQDLFAQEVRYEIGEIKRLDVTQNQILEEHHKRSDALSKDNVLREQALRQDLEKVENRVTSLETPRKVLAQLKKWAIWLGGVIGALVAIFELLKYL